MKRLLIPAATLLIVSACNSAGGSSSVSGKNPVKVETMTVSHIPLSDSHSYIGETVPEKSVILTSFSTGVLKDISVEKGDVVNAGASLATIESQTVNSAYRIAEANLEQARDGYERAERVYSSGGVSEVQMVEIRTLLTKAEASMESAQKALDDCTLKAPFRGVVSEVFQTEGVNVVPGERIARLVDLNTLKIRIPVGENRISAVSRGDKATVDIPALGISSLEATVSARNLLATGPSRSYMCTISLKDKVEALMPGMLAKVRLAGAEGENVIVIPAGAVQLDADGKYVWLYERGYAVKRRIEAGGYSGMGIIVAEGLAEGDEVITGGHQKVSGGMKITR